MNGVMMVELLVKNCEHLKIPPTDTALVNLLRMVWDIEEWAAGVQTMRDKVNPNPTPVNYPKESE